MAYYSSVKFRAAILFLLLPLAACAPGEDSHTKAFLGAVLLDGSGGPPLSNSVVVTAGERIRAVGARSSVPVPEEADKIDGSGKVIVPAPVDVWEQAEPPGLVRAASAGNAERAVRDAAGAHPRVLYLGDTPPEVAEAVLDAARGTGIPVLARASTELGFTFLVGQGAAGIVGMIGDTEDVPTPLLERLRDLKITVAPALAHAGAGLEIAKRNTLRMFRAGVPLAVATEGGDLMREVELMAEAGIPPLDVVVAATRNGAEALRQPDRGIVAAGARADLLLLSANPGADIGNLRQVAMRFTGGTWVRKR
jgi:imidazolonepropionase-like amidohydrolase